MKKLIILILFAGLGNILWGQEEFIVLQDEPVEFEADGFYIKKVTDARKNQDNIGFVQKGVFKKKKVDANFKNGVEDAVFDFLEENFVQERNAVPIVMQITKLKISESTGLPVSGKAEIRVEFYREKNGSIGKLYESEAFVEKPAVNVTGTHEERIREVIATCLQSFNESDWQTIEPMYFKEGER